MAPQAMLSNGSAWRHKCHARESGHPDLAARAGALDSRLRGNDSVKDRGPLGWSYPDPTPALVSGALTERFASRRSIARSNGRSARVARRVLGDRANRRHRALARPLCPLPADRGKTPADRARASRALMKKSRPAQAKPNIAFRFPAANTLLNINIVLFLKLSCARITIHFNVAIHALAICLTITI